MALPAIRAFRLNSSSGGGEVVYFCNISCDCEVNDGLNCLFRISFDFEVREEIFCTPFSANFLPATFFSDLSSRLLDCFST